MKAIIGPSSGPASLPTDFYVTVDGARIGGVNDWRAQGGGWHAFAEPDPLPKVFPAESSEADMARWILEQIPGCADLEIEWVK